MRRSIGETSQIKECQDIPGALSADRLVFTFPPVISRTQRGAHEWIVSVSLHRMPQIANRARISRTNFAIPPPIPITDEMRANTLTDEPLMATIIARLRTIDAVANGRTIGAEQVFEPTIVIEGKNIGRANETNVFCQALRDAYSLYIKHLRRAEGTGTMSMVPATTPHDAAHGIPGTIIRPTPMLAQIFDPEESPRTFTPTIYVQRKYDGLRAIGTMDVDSPGNTSALVPVIYGRRGLTYVGFPRIRSEIARICHAWQEGMIGAEIARASRIDARQVFEPDVHKRRTLYLDGELYKHGMSLQVISGIARRADESPESIEAQNSLNYVVYDVMLIPHAEAKVGTSSGVASADATPFGVRLEILQAIVRLADRLGIIAIQIAETFGCSERGAGKKTMYDARVPGTRVTCARKLYERFLREGFEGAILRLDAPYEHSPGERHSRALLKMKLLRDAEFTIIDYTVAEKGRSRGALLFICATDTGTSFTVTPTGPIEDRKNMARDFAKKDRSGRTLFDRKWCGKSLIVKYEALSEHGVPQRARTDSVIREII